MTGHQPHPGTGVTIRGLSEKVLPEEVARGCGVKFVKEADPFNVKEMIETLRKALKHDGTAVVVSRRECVLLTLRRKRRAGEQVLTYNVQSEKCTGCGVCISMLGCPAISWAGEKAVIDNVLCVGTLCGVCTQICPYNAIEVASK
jgi:indolepyruvate ferredoxin oxidoreductase alpha subunit